MTTIKFQPNSADINDLDHRLVNTRRIDDISPGGFAVTGPTLSVGNIPTWDANPNVRHFPPPERRDQSWSDRLRSHRQHSRAKHRSMPLATSVITATRNGPRKPVPPKRSWPIRRLRPKRLRVRFCREPAPDRSPPTSASGSDIALGLDAGRHFFNDGIKFKMTLTPVPEIEAIYPIISLCAAIAFTRILRRRRTAQLKAGAGAER